MQLARAVRNRTTGVLYVLDEPSIGLHPANITGLTGVMQDLIHDGNSVILVDHDTQILSEADWLIEMGPQAGAGGGQVIAQGSIPAIEQTRLPALGRSWRAKRSACAPRPRKASCSRWAHSAFHQRHPHRKATGHRNSQGAADCGDRGFRLRQDHHCAGKPGPRPGSRHSRPKAAGTCIFIRRKASPRSS